MIYYANFNANNGTSFRTPIEGTNKNNLIKTIRGIAESERFDGNECSWSVWYEDKDRLRMVAKGRQLSNGRRYRIDKRELRYYDELKCHEC